MLEASLFVSVCHFTLYGLSSLIQGADAGTSTSAAARLARGKRERKKERRNLSDRITKCALTKGCNTTRLLLCHYVAMLLLLLSILRAAACLLAANPLWRAIKWLLGRLPRSAGWLAGCHVAPASSCFAGSSGAGKPAALPETD